MQRPRSIDLFCRIVDNYGDIGVCWRLARQLVAEHALAVRLWVDDLNAFYPLCPEISKSEPIQTCRGVEIRHWTTAFAPLAPENVADLVIEAFACELPERFLQAMAGRDPPPCWINLEYLSAQEWVSGCQGLPSPHPATGLVKYFFFPGFTEQTGGLLREGDLLRRRDAFLDNDRLRNDFWVQLGLAPPRAEEKRISLFFYPGAALNELFACWQEEACPVTCLIPEEPVRQHLRDTLSRVTDAHRMAGRSGSLTVRTIPFLDQDDYDRLLWACDLNFVRGEDSFLRAQWAARPLVWQPYPQEEDAHLSKLQAFLQRYSHGLPLEAASAAQVFLTAWSRAEGVRRAWRPFRQELPLLAAHARSWAASLTSQDDLAARLVKFSANKLQ